MIKGLENLIYEERLKHALLSQMTACNARESNDNSLKYLKHEHTKKTVEVLKFQNTELTMKSAVFSYTELHKIRYMTTKSKGKKGEKGKQRDALISYGTNIQHRKYLNIQVIKIKIERGRYNMLNKQKIVL